MVTRKYHVCPRCGKLDNYSTKLCSVCYHKDWYIKNKEIILPKNAIWRKNHKNKMREYIRAYNLRTKLKLKLEIFKKLKPECANCGNKDIRVLQVDHVNSNGCKERKEFHYWDRIKFYKNVLKEIDSKKHQILCANCNWIKRYTNNEVPNDKNILMLLYKEIYGCEPEWEQKKKIL